MISGPMALRRRLKRKSGLPRMILFSDPVRLPDPTALLNRLPHGSGVVLRPYGLSARQRNDLIAETRRKTARQHVTLLVAADTDWQGIPAHIDGVHLRQNAAASGIRLSRLLIWRRSARHRVLSMATHNALSLGYAGQLGCDFAMLSPIFPTRSHPSAPCLGPLRAALLVRRTPLPVYALGGLNPRTTKRLPPKTFSGLAGIDLFRTSGMKNTQR